MIQQWIHFIRNPEACGHVVFLSDYDMLLTERLVQGVDVWVNTPRRPWEACGTSGMKVLVNGGINLSELDGWWDEGFDPELGWKIGNGEEYTDPDYQDEVESNALYDLLEKDIVPLFYMRTADDLPRPWISRIERHSGWRPVRTARW